MGASSSRSCRSLSLQPGILDVDEALTKISECKVVVVNINLCSRPIEGKNGATPGKIEHEYLLLDVKLKSGRNFYIRAEKYGSSNNAEESGWSINAEDYVSTRTSRRERAGIHVTCVLNHDEEAVIRSSSECGEILMEDLIKTLTAHNPHYGLLSLNCWDYARGTYSRLLKWFKDGGAKDDPISRRLEMAVQRILQHPGMMQYQAGD